MDSNSKDFDQRRKVLTLLGTSAVALPVLGLAGCGGDQSADSSMSDAADSMQEAAGDAASDMSDAAENAMDSAESAAASAEDSMNEAMDSAEETMDDAMESAETAAGDAMDEAKTIATDASRVDENGAQAKSVAYVHDASTVDPSAQPRYASGQQCSNCALYQGGDAAWGGCPLFGAGQVKATGWCNAYAPAA